MKNKYSVEINTAHFSFSWPIETFMQSRTTSTAQLCKSAHCRSASIFDYLKKKKAKNEGQRRSIASVAFRWRGAKLELCDLWHGGSVASKLAASAIRATVAAVCVFRGSHPILWCAAALQWPAVAGEDAERGGFESLHSRPPAGAHMRRSGGFPRFLPFVADWIGQFPNYFYLFVNEPNTNLYFMRRLMFPFML